MPRTAFCWRCGRDVPMLTEEEYAPLSKHLAGAVSQIRRLRLSGATFPAARRAYAARALEIYQELTGFKETNPDALWHHRLALLGPDCHACGKPLRTPRASFCAACGAARRRADDGAGRVS